MRTNQRQAPGYLIRDVLTLPATSIQVPVITDILEHGMVWKGYGGALGTQHVEAKGAFSPDR